ncbi:unnamed protein product, partial [Iphiclides podalirius]
MSAQLAGKRQSGSLAICGLLAPLTGLVTSGSCFQIAGVRHATSSGATERPGMPATNDVIMARFTARPFT